MKPRKTNIKVVSAGPVVKVFKTERPIWYGLQSARRKKTHAYFPISETEKQRRKEVARKSAASRSRTWVYDLTAANAKKWIKENGSPYPLVFLTLTLRKNIVDVKVTNALFNKFVKRLNYFVFKTKRCQLKYLSVIEFQKRGATHYHILLFNFPFIRKEHIERVWREGFIKIKAVDKVRNISAYMTKYLVKGFSDKRLDGKKRYFTSRGLIKPMLFNREEQAKAIAASLPPRYIVRQSKYETLYQGAVEYVEYRLDGQMTIFDVVAPELITG
jgi:hypothetical protein